MFHKLIKDPLTEGKLNLIASLAVFISSIFIHAYFINVSLAGLSRWFLNLTEDALTVAAQNSIISMTNVTSDAFISKIPFGLLMTAFVMVFLMLAAFLESDLYGKTIRDVFERACKIMLVPLVFLFVSALLMNVSFLAGIVLAMMAVSISGATLLKAGIHAKVNGYIITLIVTAFLLITVVMLTRNHFVTMFA